MAKATNSFEGFLAECRTHYRLVPLIEIIEEDPQEFTRLRDAFFVRNRHDLITDLYGWLDYLEDLQPRSNPNQLSLFYDDNPTNND